MKCPVCGSNKVLNDNPSFADGRYVCDNCGWRWFSEKEDDEIEYDIDWNNGEFYK